MLELSILLVNPIFLFDCFRLQGRTSKRITKYMLKQAVRWKLYKQFGPALCTVEFFGIWPTSILPTIEYFAAD